MRWIHGTLGLFFGLTGCWATHAPAEVGLSADAGEDSLLHDTPREEKLVAFEGAQLVLLDTEGRRNVLHTFNGHTNARGALVASAEFVLATWAGPWTPEQQTRPVIRALLKTDGQMLWQMNATEGRDPPELSPLGDVLTRTEGAERVTHTDGHSLDLPADFHALGSPDRHARLQGIRTTEGPDGATHEFLFYDLNIEAYQPLSSSPIAYRRDGPSVISEDGRFLYFARSADGADMHLVVESSISVVKHPVKGDATVELVLGPGRALVLGNGEPAFLVDISGETFRSLTGAPNGQVEAEWIVAGGPGFLSMAGGEPLWQIDFASGRYATKPPDGPAGRHIFADYACNYESPLAVGTGWMWQVGLQMADGIASQPTLWSPETQQWEPLGQPIFWGAGLQARQQGRGWAITTADVRNSFCPSVPTADEAEPGQGLVGNTLQLLHTSGAATAYRQPLRAGPAPAAQLSPSGDWAVVWNDGEVELLNLPTAEVQSLSGLTAIHWVTTNRPAVLSQPATVARK